jgi:hypothetical protein
MNNIHVDLVPPEQKVGGANPLGRTKLLENQLVGRIGEALINLLFEQRIQTFILSAPTESKAVSRRVPKASTQQVHRMSGCESNLQCRQTACDELRLINKRPEVI